MKRKTEGEQKLWNKYKYICLIVAVGVGLLLWPGITRTNSGQSPQTEKAEQRDMELELEEILSSISGVGQVKVMLTEASDGEKHLAQNTELSYSGNTAAPEDYLRRSETILIDTESGDSAIVTQTMYPSYRGALVVCQGGDRADVRLTVTEAVAALTGLSSDRITVAKSQL